MSRTLQEQTVHFLSDLYSVELQATAQLVTAPAMAEEPSLAETFRIHEGETRRHAEWVRARLEALGGKASPVKDAVMRLGGKGFLLFANLLTETPGRLTVHSYSYEAMEWAGYAILIRLAELGNDSETATMGRSIQAEEQAMMDRLERHFGTAEEVSHRGIAGDELRRHVLKHLAEAHALTIQSAKLLEKGERTSGDSGLGSIYARALEENRRQVRRLEERLGSLHSTPSVPEDAALRLGALNWALFFRAQQDTACKLVAFAYAVEHLGLAGVALLRETAIRADDPETGLLCAEIIEGKRANASHLARGIHLSVQDTLRSLCGRMEWRKAS